MAMSAAQCSRTSSGCRKPPHRDAAVMAPASLTTTSSHMPFMASFWRTRKGSIHSASSSCTLFSSSSSASASSSSSSPSSSSSASARHQSTQSPLSLDSRTCFLKCRRTLEQLAHLRARRAMARQWPRSYMPAMSKARWATEAHPSASPRKGRYSEHMLASTEQTVGGWSQASASSVTSLHTAWEPSMSPRMRMAAGQRLMATMVEKTPLTMGGLDPCSV
mmetsp:Transcript_50836/g.126580  ORF Transcript_50836/g.126580 Transcript_50836/m.126580 type:complete len:220 (+) Transcript_50836:530-1189(+)